MRAYRFATRIAPLGVILGALSLPAQAALCGASDLAISLGNSLRCSGAFITAGASSNSFGPFNFTHSGAYQTQGDVKIDSNEATHLGNAHSNVFSIGSVSASGSSSVTSPNGGFYSEVSADLRSGTMRASSIGTDVAGGAESYAELHDILHLLIPKSIVDPVMTFRLHVDGTVSGGPRSFGPGFAQAGFVVTGLGGHLFPGSPYFSTQSVGPYDVSLETTIDALVGAVDRGDSWLLDVDLYAQLQIIANPSYSFDFSNTARLKFEFSPGITFTSDSGALLVGPEEPRDIPEPPSLLLLISGVALLRGTALLKRGDPRAPTWRQSHRKLAFHVPSA